jgi:hypothetical protein
LSCKFLVLSEAKRLKSQKLKVEKIENRRIDAEVAEAAKNTEEEVEKQIPPLRGPTRQNVARKKRSGRSGRDDSFWLGERGDCFGEKKPRP